jgi:two-component system, OmpR family, response regulator
MAMRILVVEDEAKMAAFLRKGLSEQGMAVDVCLDGEEAYQLARTSPFDLIILDIMLPGRDGLSILKNLRREGNNVPVILLTARGEPFERVEGLELGADDYLAKPFYIDELVARVRTIIRRAAGQGAHLYEVEDLTMNLTTREVRRANEAIELTPREFSLLECLVRSPGRVLSRVQICDQVWSYDFDPGTNLVDVYVQRLRSKIDKRHELKLIHTVRGVGYKVDSTS